MPISNLRLVNYLPFLKKLANCKNEGNVQELLENAEKEEIACLVEIVANVTHGKIPIKQEEIKKREKFTTCQSNYGSYVFGKRWY